MIYSLQFTDEECNNDPECRAWIERVNATLHKLQHEFATELMTTGSSGLVLRADAGRTFRLN